LVSSLFSFYLVGNDVEVGAREIPMDDFLHNLRNPNKKRYDRNKPYDNQYRSNDRFSGNRKPVPQQRKQTDSDQMPAIKRLMENILDQQRRLVESNERMARAADRQAEALESIARHFKQPPVEQDFAAPRTALSETSVEETAPADKNDPRRAAETIIRQQRDLGHGFEQIAQTLNARGIPTVSGKGQWRAQSVSRLFNTLAPGDSIAADNATRPD
jgi:hypothetical protein